MRILCVEDNAVDADLTRRTLARLAPEIGLEVVSTLAQARAALGRAERYDVALVDLKLPDGSGLELLAEIRERDLGLAVVILTGSGAQEAAVTALKAGADDYLGKHGDYLERLPATLGAALERFRSERARKARPLRVLYAEHDAFDVDLARRHIGEHAPYIRLEVAGTAEEVLERLPASWASGCDVLLVDYGLPGLNGLELTKILRAERGLDIPIVLVSGQGSEDVAAQALRLGVSDYLVKHEGYLHELPVTLENAYRHAELLREQAALRERDARLRLQSAALEAAANAIVITDREGVIEWANPAFAALTGYALDEAIGRKPGELVKSGVQSESFYRALWQTILDRRVWRGELVNRHKDGRLYEEELTITPVLGETGEVSHFVAVKQDTTERNAQAARLGAAQRRYEELVRRIPVGVFRICAGAGGGRVFEYVSPRFCALLDLDEQSLLRDVAAVYGIVHPDDLPELRARNRHARETCEPFEWEGRCTVRGAVRWVRIESRATAREGGDVVWDGVLMDVTERREAEEALRLNAAIIAGTRDSVMVTTLEPHILSVNRAFTEITGYSREEVLGRNPSMLQSGRHGPDFFQAMWSQLLSEGYWQGQVWNRRKSGEVYPEWLSISTVRDARERTTHYVAVGTDISQLKQSEERLQHLAHHDALTDLPNRLLVHSRLEHALEVAQRRGGRVAVLFIDLDQFKTVNDGLGHPAGDELLSAVAARLKQRMRSEDTLGRLGGDEFLVLLDNLRDPQDAAVVARDMLECLSLPFALSGGQELYMHASIGISLFPDDGETASDLIRNADAAMYRAKDHGRNTYRYYTEDLTRAASERLAMETRLRQALEHGEFVLHYQPLHAVADGRLIGAEALVRWEPPGEGTVAPGRFIPVAEETGLIVPLGEWVLRTACRQAKAWHEAGIPILTMAVNISPRQFRGAGMERLVARVLEETGLPPDMLELEITETGLMVHGEQATQALLALKESGVHVAIDDFGTGYSSLAYLKRLPIQKLKIDRSFVRDLPEDSNDMAIAATIIAMARTLGLQVLAEGVETPEQLAFLKAEGCDACQGYLFSPPLPPAAFEQLFAP